MYKDPVAWDRINSFALVSYIPEPLAGFLDRMRQELVPDCFLRAHVTILPPRPVSSSPGAAWDLVRWFSPQFVPFEVDLTSVEIFPASDVIYVDIAGGSEQLSHMHATLNAEGLHCQEAFSYHPHVTLAQNLQPDQVDELTRVARARWAECSFPKKFFADKVVFVQNTRKNEWIDLGECRLGHDDAKLVAELTNLLVL
jgi:2'-5' RNA ligase